MLNARAYWLVKRYLPPSNSGKMASRFASVTSEEIIQILFWGVYYLTVLVYPKTTIHLIVGGSALDQGGKRPGGETGSPLLGQCVMRRKTGTSASSALPVQLMAAKNLLSTNRK